MIVLPKTTQSPLPPANPEAGDFWINEATMVRFVWYVMDNGQSQWVQSDVPMSTGVTAYFPGFIGPIGPSTTITNPTPRITLGPNPPGSPAEGDLWWSTITGQQSVWYNDGNSYQWVISNFGGKAGPKGEPGIIGEIDVGPGLTGGGSQLVVSIGIDNTIVALKNDLTPLAPIASPVFTGDPRAPTPAVGDADTSIATTAFVRSAIIAIPPVDLSGYAPLASPAFTGTPTAPTVFTGSNTNQQLANAASVVNYTAAFYAPISSPTFTGDPKAPTPTAGDNDTSIATTAFVQTGLGTKIGDAPNDGVQYVRQSLAWSPVAVPPGTYIGDNPPGSPSNGQLFWESDTGNFYIFYIDPGGAPGQWVQVNTSGAAATATADAYNRIVNGAMLISQENGNTASATAASSAAYYGADQWFGWWSLTGGTANFRSVALAGPPSGSKTYLQMQFPGGAPANASAYALITQRIEGLRVADLQWGTANAKPVMLRFWANASTAGTYSVRFGNAVGAATRCYVAQFTLAAATWTQVSLVVPGDTTGVWASDTSLGMSIDFCIFTGSTFTGVTGWQAGNFFAAPGQVASLPSNATFLVADVGLYADPSNTGKAPPWQTPDYATALRDCQRYYIFTAAAQFGYGGTASAGAQPQYGSISFPCQMRITPTMSIVSPAYGNGSGFTVLTTGMDGFRSTFNSAAAGTCSTNYGYIANARM